MLKFINDNDFLLVDKYKQNEDGSIGWIYNDGNATHSGFIREGMTRVDGDETIDVWDKLQTKISLGNIALDKEEVLSELITTSKDIINSTRDTLNDADIEYNGYIFQAGAQSREDIMGVVVTGTDTIWLTRDNQEVEMSAEDMKALGVAIVERKKVLVYKAHHFKDVLEEMDNPSDIKEFMATLDWGV